MSESSNDNASVAAAMAARLAAALEDAFESVALTRRAHFAANPSARPTASDIEQLITSVANTNAIVAGACSLVPGPLGALTLVPEIVVVVRNQIQMIYDLGVARGKESHLNAQFLIGIFATAMGGGIISYTTEKGGRLIVQPASLRMIQRVIRWLGGAITQRFLKRFLARFIPLAGAAAVAWWARKGTLKLGREADRLLAMPVGA